MSTAKLPPEVAEQVTKGVAILKSGGVIAFPTDTVYGLAAAFDNEPAVRRIFDLKQRPEDMALPLLVADMTQLEELAGTLTPTARRLADSFLPGALTLVLPKSAKVPDFISGGETVALRIPADPVALALIKALGLPIVGTSANPSGRPAARSAAEVYVYFGDRIDLIIDGGGRPGGRESTIVDISQPGPRLLREGAISRKELEGVCPLE